MEDRERFCRVEDQIGSSGVGGREMKDREGSSRVEDTVRVSPYCSSTWCVPRCGRKKKTEDASELGKSGKIVPFHSATDEREAR